MFRNNTFTRTERKHLHEVLNQLIDSNITISRYDLHRTARTTKVQLDVMTHRNSDTTMRTALELVSDYQTKRATGLLGYSFTPKKLIRLLRTQLTVTSSY